MKLVTEEQVEELRQAIEKTIQALKTRYPVVVQLRQVVAYIQENEFFYYVELNDVMEIEATIRSVAWDIPPNDRNLLIEVVRAFEGLLG